MTLVSLITLTAKTVGVSPALLLSVCFTESSLRNVMVPHDGNSASWGVCQVKASTARLFMPDLHPSHLMIPEINVLAAAQYLKHQIRRYHSTWCGVDAYNKGSTQCTVDISTKYIRKVKNNLAMRPWKGKDYASK